MNGLHYCILLAACAIIVPVIVEWIITRGGR